MATPRAFCVLVLCFFVELAAGQVLLILTPDGLTQCKPVELGWQGGTPLTQSLICRIVLGSSPQGEVLQQFVNLTGDSLIWNTNVTADTSVAFEITDSEGNVSQTDAIVVNSSPDQSCLNDGTSQSSTNSVDASDSTTGSTTSTAENTQSTSTRPPSATASPSPAQSGVGSVSSSRTGISSHSNPTSASNGGPSLSLEKTSSFVSTSSPVPAPTGTSAAHQTSRSVGRVVGAAVGGSMGGVLLIFCVVLLLRRRLRRRRTPEIESQRRRIGSALLDTTEPFISIPEKKLGANGALRPVVATGATNVSLAHPPPSTSVDPPPGPTPAPTPNDTSYQSNPTVTQTEPAVRRIRREVDAGSVHMDDASDGGGTLTLPPAYEDLPPRQRPSRRRRK
ncbi:hypothetical protein C8Q73DRAFT_682908 [Cubamyces lactineus]|nr:hypothetical protein C8Q73DRAFT_682908 [Cubamyces lactineus]